MGIEFTKRLLNLRYSTENLIVVQIQLVGNLINWKLAIFNNRLTCENFPTISNLLKQWTSNLLKYQWIHHLRLGHRINLNKLTKLIRLLMEKITLDTRESSINSRFTKVLPDSLESLRFDRRWDSRNLVTSNLSLNTESLVTYEFSINRRPIIRGKTFKIGRLSSNNLGRWN